MTKLLVSVRSGTEAAAAVAGGADVIDIKEPVHGSLGPASPAVWRQVCRRVGASRPISAALGELTKDDPDRRIAELGTIQLAKIGLAGCAPLVDWRTRWRRVIDRLPQHANAVAVTYVDHVRAASPEPLEVLSEALEFKCRALLVDTFDKTAGGLFESVSGYQLEQILDIAHSNRLPVVLAGSLNAETIVRALQLGPDLIAVRSAACTGGRTGSVSCERVRLLAELVAGNGDTSLTAGRSVRRPSLTQFEQPRTGRRP